MKKSAKERGEIFLVRDRIRWVFFQMMIATLQLLNRTQILIITILDVIYVIIAFSNLRRKRIFENIWITMKVICQECAILFFLIVLTIFSYTENSDFSSTKTFDVLETMVFISVIVAIAAEVLSIVGAMVVSIIQAITKKKNNQLEDDDDSEEEEWGIGGLKRATMNTSKTKKVTRIKLMQEHEAAGNKSIRKTVGKNTGILASKISRPGVDRKLYNVYDTEEPTIASKMKSKKTAM
jgi:hypothetical protein